MGNPPTRLVIAEDQPLIRRALIGLVGERSELQLEAVARDGDEALAAISAHLPDVALIDARLPRRYGQAVLHAMRARGLDTRVVFLTGQGAPSNPLLVAGAFACVSTDGDESGICTAILAAGRGLPPAALGASADQLHCRLSGRELQILELAASNRSGDEIAADLWLSPATVRTYMNRIYGKLDVKNRAAAVAYGIRHGLI